MQKAHHNIPHGLSLSIERVDDDDDFVGFRSLRALTYMVWTIREEESDTRRFWYKPLALL